MRQRIDSALSSCYLSNNSNVLTRTKDGKYKAKAVFKTGKIKDIIINKLGETLYSCIA